MTRLLFVLLLLLPGPLQARDLDKREKSPEHEAVVAPVSSTATVRTCFTPDTRCNSMIEPHIRDAKESIRVQAAYFSNRKILNELVAAKKRGVDVRVIVPARHGDSRSLVFRTLSAAGIPVRVDRTHIKVMIFDGKIVETGSYNYTNAAQKKSENVLFLSNSPAIIKVYVDQWEIRWGLSVSSVPTNVTPANDNEDMDDDWIRAPRSTLVPEFGSPFSGSPGSMKALNVCDT